MIIGNIIFIRFHTDDYFFISDVSSHELIHYLILYIYK